MYCKCKFNSTTCNWKQKWNNKTCKCEYKNDHKCKESYSLNLGKCICENSKYLKSVADTSMTKCDEIIIVMKDLPTKKYKCYDNKCYKCCFNKLT